MLKDTHEVWRYLFEYSGIWVNLTRFLAASIFITVHKDVPDCFLQVITEKLAADCSQTAPNPFSRTSAGFALLKAPPRGVIASTPLAVPRAHPPPSSTQSCRARPSQRHGHTRPLGPRVPAPCSPKALSLPPQPPHPARQQRRTPPSEPPRQAGPPFLTRAPPPPFPPSAPRHWLPRPVAVAHAPRRELELGELARGGRIAAAPGAVTCCARLLPSLRFVCASEMASKEGRRLPPVSSRSGYLCGEEGFPPSLP